MKEKRLYIERRGRKWCTVLYTTVIMVVLLEVEVNSNNNNNNNNSNNTALYNTTAL
jgi:hypothetical protein